MKVTGEERQACDSSRPAARVSHAAIPVAPEMDFARLPYSKRDPAFFPRVADPFA